MKKRITLANGETYAYLEQGVGTQTLVLIHGNLSSSLYYQPLLDRLAADIRVLAPDLRGFGDSTYAKPVTSLAELADDLRLFLDALGIARAAICGWSLGGGVAMALAAASPDRVEKLILIDSTTHRGYPIFKKDAAFRPIVGSAYASPAEMASDPLQVAPVVAALQAGNAAFMAYIYDLTIYTNKKPAPEANAVYIAETLKQRNLPDVDFALASLNMGDVPNFYAPGDGSIHRIVCPVLHFWGVLDKTVPEAMVQDNIAAISGPSTYIRLENCGHSPLVDQPDELASQMIGFLR